MDPEKALVTRFDGSPIGSSLEIELKPCSTDPGSEQQQKDKCDPEKIDKYFN